MVALAVSLRAMADIRVRCMAMAEVSEGERPTFRELRGEVTISRSTMLKRRVLPVPSSGTHRHRRQRRRRKRKSPYLICLTLVTTNRQQPVQARHRLPTWLILVNPRAAQQQQTTTTLTTSNLQLHQQVLNQQSPTLPLSHHLRCNPQRHLQPNLQLPNLLHLHRLPI
jgi:hypothetical protein